jgi:glycosyltransferase involved in cell wall biosynthesis
MRILLVSQHFYPESFRVNDIARFMRARGHAVDVLTGQPNYPEGKSYAGYRAWNTGTSEWQGVLVHRVPLAPRGSASSMRLVLNYVSFIVSAATFGLWRMRGRRYDFVFVYASSPLLQAIPAILIARLKGAKVIVWVQDLWPESLAATGHVRNRVLLKGVSAVVRWIYHATDLVLVQSRAFIARVRPLAGDRPIEYFPNLAERVFEELPPSQEKKADGLFSVMFAGNVGAAQAIDVMLEAAERLRSRPDIRFVVVGTGSRWEWLQKEISRRSLENIELLGRRPVEAMPALLAAADVLLVTLSDDPVFALTVPSKVQAYLAVGRPIIASLAGEGALLIEESQAGVAAPPGDAAALADAIVKVADLPSGIREAWGHNGFNYYQKHFRTDKLLDELESILSRLSDGKYQ